MFSPSSNRLILQIDIQYYNLTNLFVEMPEKEDGIADWILQLFRYFRDQESVSAEAATHIIDGVLQSCRQQDGEWSPLLGNSLYLRDASGKSQPVEAMDPALESVLRTAHEMFGDEPTLLPLVSRLSLQHAVVEEGSFMVTTKSVWLREELYVARGPAFAESTREDLSEVSNLLSLLTYYPNVIPPLTVLITFLKDDKRIC